MGLLSAVLTAPLAPVRALLWLGEQLAARAEADESLRPPSVQDRLMDVDEALAAGEISAERAAELEEELLAELLATRPGEPGAGWGQP